jgi:hypothetical protein
MRLREFELDLPDADKNVRANFRKTTRCVSALYERCFPGLDVDGGWKLLVECVPRVERPNVRNLLGVFALQVQFELQAFSRVSEFEQKKLAVGALHCGAIRIAEIQHWDKAAFDSARDCVVQHAYINEWTLRKPKKSPDRKHQASIFCSHGVARFRAWLVVEDQRGDEVLRQLVIDDEPDEFAFVPKLGELKWQSPDSVTLAGKDGTIVGRAKLPALS